MEQETQFEALPDLREIRTTFLDKRLAYAMSYEYSLECLATVALDRNQVRVCLRPTRYDAEGKDPSYGRAFHVLGGDRVPGLDGLGRDLPDGFRVRAIEESVVLYTEKGASVPPAPSGELAAGSMSGRMILEAPSDKVDREPLRISVTYDGTLRLLEAVTPKELEAARARVDGSSAVPIRASAFVTTFFEILHPKYHWLAENACIAFGTWEIKGGRVSVSFDVYCAA